ncbi:hypothetical protein LMG8520_1961 [Lactococcus lactis subsp. lactis]|uniref:Uncharacterized protein n=2 Tax=Lactococcus lactis TaxID=1358 RepID=A0A2A5S9Z4_LACLH|nr:hypothetical protein LMG8520_1961 [Lactococcus lactis subsp. lactis]PCS10347.1 hypothetical protein RU90_GL001472 [Lactococcus lactis subsp. hordniae]
MRSDEKYKSIPFFLLDGESPIFYSVYGRLSQVLTRSLATYTSSPESPK